LVASVTYQVVAGWPWSSASTDLQLGIPRYHLLESVTVKSTREWLQGGSGQPEGLAGWPPPGPTGHQTLHIASLCQVHPQGDTYFGGILNFLVIS
jgi:hypothetical protein